jgi:hypothetical protein
MNGAVYEWETNTKTIYDGLLVLNGKIIKYNKLTLKSEILYQTWRTREGQTITMRFYCDYAEEPPKEYLRVPAEISLDFEDKHITWEGFHISEDFSPDGSVIIELDRWHPLTTMRMDIHYILEDKQ